MFRGSEDALDLRRIGGGIGGGTRPVDGEIARRVRPNLRRARLERVAGVGHRLERLILDIDEFAGILRGKGALGDHHRHRLADMHDAVAGERRTVRQDELGAAAARHRRVPRNIADAFHVLRGENRNDARRVGCRRSIDTDDAGKGVRRTHEIGESLVRQRRIGDVAAEATHQCVVFDAAAMLRWSGCG